jgi:hypothetical protein
MGLCKREYFSTDVPGGPHILLLGLLKSAAVNRHIAYWDLVEVHWRGVPFPSLLLNYWLLCDADRAQQHSG